MTLRQLLIASGVLAACLIGSAQAAPAAASHPAVLRALAHIKAQAAALHAGADDAFAARDLVVDANGAEHVRFDRRFKGLHVIGGDLVVHSDARGAFRGASHTLRSALRQLDLNARFDDEAAVQYAQALFNGTAERNPRSQLVIYAGGEAPALAHDVTIEGFDHEGTPSVLHLIIDAHSLQLLDRYDEVQTAAVNGTGNTLLSGAVSIPTDSTSSGFAMRDPSRSNNATVNMKNRRFGAGTLFTDTDNVWGNFATSDAATVGADAHYGMTLTWDYFKTVHSRNGIDGTGKTASSRVHYGNRYSNAFWNDSCFCMTYGDGDGVTLLPLVAIDIAGHEMSHGVTANTAQLIYSGESGGLNEGNSDIFGAMVEYHANNAKQTPNYLVGERIYKSNAGQTNPTKALRYMFKPSLDGRSPDCYTSTIGNLDVHYSSGVANHFFYLLAEGAVVPPGFNLTPSQLVCNGNTAVGGIGRDAAQRIWYRALSVYMTSNTNYKGARTATLNAAADLFGAGSPQHNAVAAAWSAVSVN
jgi:zinc metalloprotease ZmpA